MDGFHALGTQGRSHPRQRQDPDEEKLLKKVARSLAWKLNKSSHGPYKATWSAFRAKSAAMGERKVWYESKEKPRTSRPLTLASTSLPSFVARWLATYNFGWAPQQNNPRLICVSATKGRNKALKCHHGYEVKGLTSPRSGWIFPAQTAGPFFL